MLPSCPSEAAALYQKSFSSWRGHVRLKFFFFSKAAWAPHRCEVKMLEQSAGARRSMCFGADGLRPRDQHGAGCGIPSLSLEFVPSAVSSALEARGQL